MSVIATRQWKFFQGVQVLLHKIWEDFCREAASIKAAPRSFGILALILSGLIYIVLSAYYGTQITGRDTQISILRDTIGNYQSKLNVNSPSQAAAQFKALQDELDDAKNKIQALTNPPRDKNGIYQGGRLIGAAQGVVVNSEKNTVNISVITVIGDIDKASNIEYRNLILFFVKSQMYGQERMGLDVKSTYDNVMFNIIGYRQDAQ